MPEPLGSPPRGGLLCGRGVEERRGSLQPLGDRVAEDILGPASKEDIHDDEQRQRIYDEDPDP